LKENVTAILDEIRLYRMRREFPHLLPRAKRAPFVDPEWDKREDPVPVWMMLVHALFMGGLSTAPFDVATLIAQFELESGVEILLARMFREMS
jgi:hypothetical protein